MVECAELLVDTVNTADWAFFAKNGNDATQGAILTARAYTHRKKLIFFSWAHSSSNHIPQTFPFGMSFSRKIPVIPASLVMGAISSLHAHTFLPKTSSFPLLHVKIIFFFQN